MQIHLELSKIVDTLQITMVINLLISLRISPAFGDMNSQNGARNKERIFHKTLISNETAPSDGVFGNSQSDTKAAQNFTNPDSPADVLNESTDTNFTLNDSLNFNYSDNVLNVDVYSNDTSKPAHARTPSVITKLELGSQTYVIIMLSTVVLLALLFTMFGLFMKAEAHSKAQPSFHNGLLDNNLEGHFPLSTSLMEDV